MDGIYTLLIAFAVWIILGRFILPRLGIQG